MSMLALDSITQAREFFQISQGKFQQVQAIRGITVQYCRIANKTVALQFTNPTLIAAIMPALAHLVCQPTENVQLTVLIGDSFSVSLPPPPWNQQAYAVRSEVVGYNGQGFYTAFNLDSGSLSMLDTTTQQAIYWVKDGQTLPFYEKGSPLLTIWHWWLQTQGLHLVHAAVVGLAGIGVLLPGKGGSGKSTTAINCLCNGLDYVGDDYCLIDGPNLTAYSLYSSAKLAPTSLAYFPQLMPYVVNQELLTIEKGLVFLKTLPDLSLVDCLTIKAILIPQVLGLPQTRLVPAKRMAALQALAPSTIFQLAGAGQPALDILTQLVKALPCYYLQLGTDIDQIPLLIREFILTLRSD